MKSPAILFLRSAGVICPTVRSDVSHRWRLPRSLPAHGPVFPDTHRPQVQGRAAPVSAAIPMAGSQPHPLPTVLIIRSSFPDLTSWAQPTLLLTVSSRCLGQSAGVSPVGPQIPKTQHCACPHHADPDHRKSYCLQIPYSCLFFMQTHFLSTYYIQGTE